MNNQQFYKENEPMFIPPSITICGYENTYQYCNYIITTNHNLVSQNNYLIEYINYLQSNNKSYNFENTDLYEKDKETEQLKIDNSLNLEIIEQLKIDNEQLKIDNSLNLEIIEQLKIDNEQLKIDNSLNLEIIEQFNNKDNHIILKFKDLNLLFKNKLSTLNKKIDNLYCIINDYDKLKNNLLLNNNIKNNQINKLIKQISNYKQTEIKFKHKIDNEIIESTIKTVKLEKDNANFLITVNELIECNKSLENKCLNLEISYKKKNDELVNLQKITSTLEEKLNNIILDNENLKRTLDHAKKKYRNLINENNILSSAFNNDGDIDIKSLVLENTKLKNNLFLTNNINTIMDVAYLGSLLHLMTINNKKLLQNFKQFISTYASEILETMDVYKYVLPIYADSIYDIDVIVKGVIINYNIIKSSLFSKDVNMIIDNLSNDIKKEYDLKKI
jgi:hypothetical protein